MTPFLIVIIILSILATLLFVAGYIRGIKHALSDYQRTKDQVLIGGVNRTRYSLSTVIAVVVSAVVIALVGVNPVFVYLGPILAIGTNAMIGFAFFYDRES